MTTRMTFKRLAAARAITLSGLLVLAAAAPCLTQTARAQATLSTASVRMAETETGNLLADAVRAAGSAEIGLVPAAAFKTGASVAKPATPEQAASLVEPASDAVVVLNLRGDQILAALERSVSFSPQPSAGYLQVSGLRFTYDTRKDGGKRVYATTVNGAPLEAARTYKVATTKPLANGQQGYFQIWQRDDIKSDTGKTLAIALADYAKSRGGTLTASVDGRINQAEK